jgi:hypothetical protein
MFRLQMSRFNSQTYFKTNIWFTINYVHFIVLEITTSLLEIAEHGNVVNKAK